MIKTRKRVRLVREAVAYIEANPRQWNQNTWLSTRSRAMRNPPSECNTTMCLAGHIMAIEMGRERFLSRAFWWDWGQRWKRDDDFDIEERAVKLLGLEWDEARAVFHCTTKSIHALKAHITYHWGITFEDEEAEVA